jgi:predicted alpha/beta superfamily hydrolase
MRNFFIITFLFLSVIASGQIDTDVNQLSIGEQVSFHSEILDQDRILNVYLPDEYSPDSAQTYPVVYVLDGSFHEDFIHIAGLVQFLSFPWLDKMPNAIVVGISNINRYHDFTFPCDIPEYVELNPVNGGSGKFIEFLKKEVQPIINESYKIDTQSRTIIGQSLGGLLATEILFNSSDLFDNYLIVSPSLWWDEQSLLKTAFQNTDANRKVFIAVGKEGKVMQSVAKKLHKKLQKSSFEKEHLGFRFFPELDHGDALHLSAYWGLEQIF